MTQEELSDAHCDRVAKSGDPVKTYYMALTLVLFAILAPIWVVKYPGMVDYPNHLARCYILAHYHDNPVWQQRYFVVHQPIPNLAMDLIVVPLLRVFPLILCGKLFLSLGAVLFVVGCSEVGRAAIGKPNWLALVCAFTFYNADLLYGFVNYVFGIGVFLCGFAYWLRVRKAMSPLRFLLCCLLSVIAFLAHLSSIVILGAACVTVASLDFAHDRKVRNLVVKLIWLACPVLLMAGFLTGSGRVGNIVWRSPYSKAISLLAPIRSYSTSVDFGVVAVLLVCGPVIVKGSRVHSGAAASLVLLMLYIVTPMTLLTSAGADLRYVVPAFLLLALSIEPTWSRWRKAAMAAALAAMVIHTASITANWITISRRSEQVLAMGQILPTDARIYALEPAYSGSTKMVRGYIHMIQFWTVSRRADISTLFALPGQQPLVFRQLPCDGTSANPEWAQCLATYDYIWTYDPSTSLRQDILHIATPASTWDKVTLWRVDRKSAPSMRTLARTNSVF